MDLRRASSLIEPKKKSDSKYGAESVTPTQSRAGKPSGLPGAFLERLSKVMKIRDVAKVAAAIGVSRSALYKWLGGRSEPSLVKVAAFARVTNVRLSWLVEGEGPMSRDELPGYILPFSLRKPPPLAFEKGWLSDTFGPAWIERAPFEGGELPRPTVIGRLVQVQDDSMHPTLNRGDLLLCGIPPRGTNEMPANGIYLVRLLDSEPQSEHLDTEAERLVPRRVERLLEGKEVTAIIRCDNPAYPSEIRVSSKNKRAVIADMVFWRGTRI